MDPARIHREPDDENLRTDFIGCPSLLTRHAKKKKNLFSNFASCGCGLAIWDSLLFGPKMKRSDVVGCSC